MRIKDALQEQERSNQRQLAFGVCESIHYMSSNLPQQSMTWMRKLFIVAGALVLAGFVFAPMYAGANA